MRVLYHTGAAMVAVRRKAGKEVRRGEEVRSVYGSLNLSFGAAFKLYSSPIRNKFPTMARFSYPSDQKDTAYVKKLGIKFSKTVGKRLARAVRRKTKMKFERPGEENFTYLRRYCYFYTLEKKKKTAR